MTIVAAERAREILRAETNPGTAMGGAGGNPAKPT